MPRAVHLAQLRRCAPTYLHPEGGDSIFYDRVAAGEPAPRRAYFHSPLYRGFLGVLYAVCGRDLTAVRVVQHLIGAAAVVLTYLLTLGLFGSRPTALLAALLHGLLGPLVFYEGQLLVAALLPGCLVLAAFALLRVARGAGRAWCLLLGAAVGLGALGRPTILVWLPPLALWCLLRPGPDAGPGPGPGPRSRRWQHAVLLGLGAALLVAPVTLRNYVVERDWVLITSSAGLNFYIGNNPRARGTYNLPEGLWFRPGEPQDDFMGSGLVQRELGRTPRSSEISAWWAARGWDFIARNPGRAAALLLTRARLLLSDYEHPHLYNYEVYRQVSPILWWLPTAGVVIVPGLVGLALALLSRGDPARRLLAAGALLHGAAYLPFFVVGRYRGPWLVLLVPFAAWGVTRLAASLRRPRPRRAAALLLAMTAVALLSFALPVERMGAAPQYEHFGRASLAAGRPRQAVRWYRRAVAADPASPRAHEGLGLALSLHGDPLRAREALLRSVRLWPTSGRLHNNLGLVARRLGRAGEAEQAFRRAIRLEPDLAEAYANLGDLLESRGRPGPAAQAFRAALDLAPSGATWIPSVRRRWRRLQGDHPRATTP